MARVKSKLRFAAAMVTSFVANAKDAYNLPSVTSFMAKVLP